jgi:hypothetical protein
VTFPKQTGKWKNIRPTERRRISYMLEQSHIYFQHNKSSMTAEMFRTLMISNSSEFMTKFPGHSLHLNTPTKLVARSDGKAQQAVSSSRKSSRRRVTFQETHQILITPSLDEFTSDEISSTWYSFVEFNEIKVSCCRQIEMMERGRDLKGIKYCARGLENHTKIRSLARQMNRSYAIETVLSKSADDAALAEAYRGASASCQLWASAVGLADQKEAEIILEDAMDEYFSSQAHSKNKCNKVVKSKPAMPARAA